MNHDRRPHPQDCRRCRHEVTFGVIRKGEALERINGMCLQGHDWGHGCAHYAERAHKPRRGEDLVKG
jgi:hypothetical protein